MFPESCTKMRENKTEHCQEAIVAKLYMIKSSLETDGWTEVGIIPDLSSFCESHLLHNSGMVLREVIEYCKKKKRKNCNFFKKIKSKTFQEVLIPLALSISTKLLYLLWVAWWFLIFAGKKQMTFAFVSHLKRSKRLSKPQQSISPPESSPSCTSPLFKSQMYFTYSFHGMHRYIKGKNKFRLHSKDVRSDFAHLGMYYGIYTARFFIIKN